MDGMDLVLKKEEAEKLLRLTKLKFNPIIDEETGEHTGRYERVKQKKSGLTYLREGDGTVRVRGNWYKFYTGLHNVGLFPVKEYKEAFTTFCASHGNLDPEGVEVDKQEVGVNVETERCVNCVLDEIVTYKHRRRGGNPAKRDGLTYYFDFEDYKLLFYNKTAKNGLKRNVLRVELVARKKLLNRYGIYTLKDLYDDSKVLLLYQHLRNAIERMVFTDREMDLEKLPKEKAQTFLSLRNDIDWIELNRADPKNITRTEEQYQAIIERYGTNNTKKWMLGEFDRKLEDTGISKKAKSEEFSAVDKSWKEHHFDYPGEAMIQPFMRSVLTPISSFRRLDSG